jgi:hypothetical protein
MILKEADKVSEKIEKAAGEIFFPSWGLKRVGSWRE